MSIHQNGIITGDDGKTRCWWHGNHQDYIAYHDNEWGRPVNDDKVLFEKISLEGFQSGLSWLTILRKRENFRRAFAGFDFLRVANYTTKDVERLVQDAGIVRHRRKIESVINNAQRACELVDEFGSLATYFWQFEPEPKSRPLNIDYATLSQISKTQESTLLSKDLKRRGWSYVGPTTVYAFMQAMGLVNDHLQGCFMRSIVDEERYSFQRPSSPHLTY